MKTFCRGLVAVQSLSNLFLFYLMRLYRLCRTCAREEPSPLILLQTRERQKRFKRGKPIFNRLGAIFMTIKVREKVRRPR